MSLGPDGGEDEARAAMTARSCYACKRHSRSRWFEAVDAITQRRNPNGASNIRGGAQNRAPEREERALAASTSASSERELMRIQNSAEQGIVRVGRHHSLRDVRLHVEDGALLQQEIDQTRVAFCRWMGHEGDVGNGSHDAFDVEGILETHWQTVQRAHGLAVCGFVFVQLFCSSESLVEEYFRQAVHLCAELTKAHLGSQKILTSCCAMAARLQNASVRS
jgi:hypothetical protein